MKYIAYFLALVDFANFLPSESLRSVWAVNNAMSIVYKTELIHGGDRSLIQYSETLRKKKKNRWNTDSCGFSFKVVKSNK